MNYDFIPPFSRRSRARIHAAERTRFGGTTLTIGRILLAIAMILPAVIIVDTALRGAFAFLNIDPLSSIPLMITGGLVGTLAVISGYAVYVHWIEARPVAELARQNAPRELFVGATLGAALFTTAVGIVWLAGGYEITGMNPWIILVPAITGALFWATLEELIYRGVLLRIIETKLGTWIALGISSLAFAGFHVVATPNVTLWTGVSVFIAGLWLGGAYLYTRRLWFPIALHATWNFTQGAVFGIAVSGDEAGQGLFVGTTSGPTWLSGGAYGLEGSVIVVGVLLLASIVILRQAQQQERFQR